MAFVRTFLVILALVLSWGAVRADPAMMFGLLGCAMPLLGSRGARRRRRVWQSAPMRTGGLALQ